jgi:hypothetical protein
MSADDRARRFLAWAVACTPARRRDWGRAMLAELDQVNGTGARWLFVLGAARVALVPPRSGRLAAILLTAAAAVAVGAIRLAVPRAGLVALIVVPGLPALAAWWALARPGSRRPVSAIGRSVQVVAVAGIVACPVLGVRLDALHPGDFGPAGRGGQVAIVLFAAEIAAYLVLVLRRQEPLGAGRHSGLPGLFAALATAGVYLNSRLHTPLNLNGFTPFGGVSGAVVTAAFALPLAAGAVVLVASLARGRATGQCLHRGAAEALWAAVLTGPGLFIVFLLTISRGDVAAQAAHPWAIAKAHREGATNVQAWVATNDLGMAILLLTAVSAVLVIIFQITRAYVAEPAGPAAGSSPAAAPGAGPGSAP